MQDKFDDYKNEEILLSKDVWEKHIQLDHPKMTKEVIADTLKFPSIVCKSQHQFMESRVQYYKGPWKNINQQERYFKIVVTKCNDGNWISTAHIRSKISCGEILYKEGA